MVSWVTPAEWLPFFLDLSRGNTPDSVRLRQDLVEELARDQWFVDRKVRSSF